MYQEFLYHLGFTAQQFECDKPLAPLTHFKTGGNAEVFVQPTRVEQLQTLLQALNSTYPTLPITIWGDASNVLVSDEGLKGFVIDTKGLNFTPSLKLAQPFQTFSAGSLTSDIALLTAQQGFAGLHNFYGLPGTLGGACYMNASCYGASIADLFHSAIYLTLQGEEFLIKKDEADWAYKVSPFQHNKGIITEVHLTLPYTGKAENLVAEAESKLADRTTKGHFKHPCAGSTFKNNRSFGMPTGQIIDSLGLKGFALGNAKVSPYHGNIIINAGGATSTEIARLITHIQQQVLTQRGFKLEPEVVFLGSFTL